MSDIDSSIKKERPAEDTSQTAAAEPRHDNSATLEVAARLTLSDVVSMELTQFRLSGV